MLELGCKIQLKKPCHVGFRQAGRQILDDKGDPYIPSHVLRTQITGEAYWFASSEGGRVSPPSCTDALTPEGENVRAFKLGGKEYFIADLFFELKLEEKDTPIYLAALKSMQNVGFGGDTSKGFGYNKLSIVNSDLDFDFLESKNRAASIFAPDEEFFPPHFVKLGRGTFEAIKRNWRGWERSYNPGAFKRRFYYKVQASKPLTRGILRTLFLKKTGIEHGKIPVCPPKKGPCQVCDLLGCLNHKSRIIFRPFPKATFLICENLKEEERDLLEDALREGGYKFLLQEKETLTSYLK